MTKLVWDQRGERRYETGIDRGVLFLRDGLGVPWNGLTSVTENRAREVKSYYIDGIKYLDHHVPGSYSAQLSAYTYPDELDPLLGNREFSPGVFLHDQRAQQFGLCYRTLQGNDVDGQDHAYTLHVIFNALATESDATFDTIADTVEIQPFQWNLTGVPGPLFGARPTNHISMNSRTMDSAKLQSVEEVLYGTETTDPSLPQLMELLSMVSSEETPV